MARRATFLQVTPKSRSAVRQYGEIENEVTGLIGRSTAALATPPGRRFATSTVLFAHRARRPLSRADVAMVTPLRDGMNLVAKEFVAAQDPDNPGVLVLSQFAGAAQELDRRLIVNPARDDAVAAGAEASARNAG